MPEQDDIKAGDCVRLTSIPPEVLEPAELPEDIVTRQVFEYCLGRAYRVDDVFDDQEYGTTYVLAVKRDVEPRFGTAVDGLYVARENIVPLACS